MRIGANYLEDGKCTFVVWAPFLERVELKIISPKEKITPLEKDGFGYWRTVVKGLSFETLYLYRLEGEKERPDPASHFQPQGVHEPSQVIDHRSFNWEDRAWWGINIHQMIMYELHVGTFTQEGTFDAIIPRLDEIRDVGINAIELMPVAQFPGERNWGYDGVYPFAVQNSYGGPDGLKRLVNECHKKGMAVILDVVYNHLGPEGNYFSDYGPYFTERYKTPWGKAINFDGAYSDEVRNIFIENALYWFRNYHVDALRLDAIHSILDMSAKHFLEELAERVQEFSKQQGRKFYLIAESNLNDAKVIRPRELGGYGVDSQWSDDFHHALHTLLTGEDKGYYVDFGTVENLVKSLREGFVYSGVYSKYRKRRHGNSSKDRPGEQFVIFSQNHDQIGNRMLGERLSNLVSFEGLKLAAGLVLLSPFIPLFFMGEEYGEEAPFIYFSSHSDPDLIEAVRKGRKEEFKAFGWTEEPPDPQAIETFLRSKINWEKRKEGKHKVLFDFYRSLIKLRKEIPALSNLSKDNLDVWGLEKERILFMERWKDSSYIFSIFNLNKKEQKIKVSTSEGKWKRVLDSSDNMWNGPGTLLPEKISSGDEIIIRGFSLATYKRAEI
ncbi:MAG: malto-oligosyltrehalose trehalohydrolase [Candidatus Dadabacteria bacterium]|nr:malto-oligosyltrehalose trehalohydrolase [Candidatus Dadabacteria bacterium]